MLLQIDRLEGSQRLEGAVMLDAKLEAAQGMVALAHVILDDGSDVMDGDALGKRDMGGREDRGSTRDNHHDGLVVVARCEVDVRDLGCEHQAPELCIQNY